MRGQLIELINSRIFIFARKFPNIKVSIEDADKWEFRDSYISNHLMMPTEEDVLKIINGGGTEIVIYY